MSLSFVGLGRPALDAKTEPRRVSCLVCSATEKPLRVGIAGGGIAGLSVALALSKRKDALNIGSVHLFEPRPSLDPQLGGALNLSGGAAVLAKEYGLSDALWAAASPLEEVVAYETRGGSELLRMKTADAARHTRGAEKLLSHNGKLHVMTIMRSDLMEVIAGGIALDTISIDRGQTVVGVQKHDAGGGSFVLENGTPTPKFDLIIGADGIGSAVRKSVVSEPKPARYAGIRIQFAVSPPAGEHTLPVAKCGTLEQYFGDGAYALNYGAGPDTPTRRSLVVLSYKSPTPRSENEAYAAQAEIKDDMLRRLRLACVPDSVCQVTAGCERFIEVGVFYHNPLSRWTSGSTVLVGDACHAMPPFLGQGANQAIQDAHALADSLERRVRLGISLEESLKEFESKRRAPTAAIMETSRIIGALETQSGPGVVLRNNLFRMMGLSGAVEQVFMKSAVPSVLQ